jgi:ABC-type amino acid transport substrate-binding protein
MIRTGRWAFAMARLLVIGCLCLGLAGSGAPAERSLRYFPVGPIYDYRWHLLELALARGAEPGVRYRLAPCTEDITQDRSLRELEAGSLDVLALGVTPARMARLLPVRVDILKGIVAYRVFLIRAKDQDRIARMDLAALRRDLVVGLQRGWADLPVMEAAGFAVESASSFDSLFRMLAAGRFDAFPRGLNEAYTDLEQCRIAFPPLAVERTKALYFPFPVYFWVNRGRPDLARVIERGLERALADGSFRKLFQATYAREIKALRAQRRQVLTLSNPILPAGTVAPDTSWWWPR